MTSIYREGEVERNDKAGVRSVQMVVAGKRADFLLKKIGRRFMLKTEVIIRLTPSRYWLVRLNGVKPQNKKWVVGR